MRGLVKTRYSIMKINSRLIFTPPSFPNDILLRNVSSVLALFINAYRYIIDTLKPEEVLKCSPVGVYLIKLN
jgi:hypothetical protein